MIELSAPTVLVVDDARLYRLAAATLLQEAGFRIAEADSGEAALAIVAEPGTDFDLILLDVTMPGIDGFETCRRLKAIPAMADIPVIFCSGLSDVGEVIAGLDAGASDYVTKPYRPTELLARVRAHVRIKRLQDDRERLHRQLQQELARAGQVQADLLALDPPLLPGFELAARCISARNVGGDFYTWSGPESGRFQLSLGDVMGKGMPAALLMATARAALQAAPREDGPAATIDVVSRALRADLERSSSFITLFHGCLDVASRRLRYVDAGHGHAFVRRADGSAVSLKPVGGFPLGVLPGETYQEATIGLEPGDALVVYSDGIVESRPDLTLDPATLARELEDAATASEMVDRLVNLARVDPLPDDLTVLVLRCTDG